MVVIPAGSFIMGSPVNEPDRAKDEAQVRVTIAVPFAVGKYAVTFDEWDSMRPGLPDQSRRGYRPIKPW
jgi:formylglycine-generating enzyme required for sulfatase activity